jgi:molecular chaperone GrpE
MSEVKEQEVNNKANEGPAGEMDAKKNSVDKTFESSNQNKEDNINQDNDKKNKKDEGNENKADDKTELKNTIESLTDSLRRLQAEFDNYRKRVHKENQELIALSNKDLLERLLPILDHIELAEKNKQNKDEFINGTIMIFKEFKDLLDKEGVKEIKALGEDFNPYVHQALLTEKSSKEKHNVVIDVLKKGFMYKERILRPAMVKVGKYEGENAEE